MDDAGAAKRSEGFNSPLKKARSGSVGFLQRAVSARPWPVVGKAASGPPASATASQCPRSSHTPRPSPRWSRSLMCSSHRPARPARRHRRCLPTPPGQLIRRRRFPHCLQTRRLPNPRRRPRRRQTDPRRQHHPPTRRQRQSCQADRTCLPASQYKSSPREHTTRTRHSRTARSNCLAHTLSPTHTPPRLARWCSRWEPSHTPAEPHWAYIAAPPAGIG
jgi:hypothetical protein